MTRSISKASSAFAITSWLVPLIIVAAFIYLGANKSFADEPVIAERSLSPFQLRERAIDAGKAEDRITGNANAAPEDAYPWIVSIGVVDTPHTLGHFCGGALLAEDWVLTAAHCLAGILSPDKIQVQWGTNYLSRKGNVSKVASMHVHPDYKKTAKNVPVNDIALLKLKTEVTRPSIDLLPEGNVAEALQGGKRVLIAGWGRTEFGDDQPLSNSLLHAYIEIMSHSECNSQDVLGSLVNDRMICAGAGTLDSCQGDSGGPAMSYVGGTPYLVGVISWGVKCGQKKFPGVYARASEYRGWITKQLQN